MKFKTLSLLIPLLLISSVYIFSLPPVLSTGDGGELIAASYGLGIPHPSGYPLYVQIGKLFSFLPFGNIGIRVELISVFFSIFTLSVVYFIIFKISGQTREAHLAAIASIVFLAFSYSFFGQSIVAKFYTLNSFLVMFLLLLGIKIILNGYDRRIQFLTSFILGLTLSAHHTGFMMIVPLVIVGIFYYRDFLKNLPLSIVFFLLGFSLNLYLYIRGIKENLFSMIPVTDWDSFLTVFLRKTMEQARLSMLHHRVLLIFTVISMLLKTIFILLKKILLCFPYLFSFLVLSGFLKSQKNFLYLF